MNLHLNFFNLVILFSFLFQAVVWGGDNRYTKMTQHEKADVFQEVIDVLTDSESGAFALEVDFEPLIEQIESEQFYADFMKAKTQMDVVHFINKTFKRLKASHLNLGFVEDRLKYYKSFGFETDERFYDEEFQQFVFRVNLVRCDSVAQDVGIRVGDLIVKVKQFDSDHPNGVATAFSRNYSLDLNSDDIELTFVRKNGAKFQRKTARLQAREFKSRFYEPDFCHYDLSKKSIPIVKVQNFSPVEYAHLDQSSSYDYHAMENLFRSFIQNDIKAVVIDLRDNGGGEITAASHFGQIFHPGKVAGVRVNRANFSSLANKKNYQEIFDQLSRNSAPMYRLPEDGTFPFFTGKIAVLINQRTASAAEMVAAGLQELAGARVYGTSSAGQVLGSRIFHIGPDRSLYFQFPQSDWITAKGRRLEGVGVVPDVEFEKECGLFPTNDDQVLQRALSDLAP